MTSTGGQVILKASRLWAALCLVVSAVGLQATAGPVPAAERYARKCRRSGGERILVPQGTMLWGTRPDWTGQPGSDARQSVLVSASLERVAWPGKGSASLKLEGGHLAGEGIVGSVLRGKASDGRPVEVAICEAEPSLEDPGIVRYRIEVWNEVAQEWDNPCVATGAFPDPRAIAVGGVWDTTGARHDAARELTFACEAGVISKCISWGYRPWDNRNGVSLVDAHQACTRMARADYCGDGTSHTHESTTIDYYDSLGVARRTTERSPAWDPSQATFEAAWAPDGATCFSRTRDGRAPEEILQGCPGRFHAGAAELGDGDRCRFQRTDAGAPVLRNR